MLSYRHSFHAGNFADVLKHIVLIELLQHMVKKEKAFSYIDTHSGAGLYHLRSDHAEKNQEYQKGITKIVGLDWPELLSYQTAVKAVNAGNELTFYPGSPLLATQYLRSQDQAWCFEMHPEDSVFLANNLRPFKQARVRKEDGLKGLLSLLPPDSRRALVLIDPSYEIKSDYDDVFQTVVKAHKKFATGMYAIWYPVVDRARINRLDKQLISSGITHIQRYEFGLHADSSTRGMTSSGMFVINPPWQLMDTMTALLPKLVKTLGENGGAFYRADMLVAQ